MGTLENARLLVVPQGGHGFGGMLGAQCIPRLQAAFLATSDPAAVDAGCLAAMRRPPFLLWR